MLLFFSFFPSHFFSFLFSFTLPNSPTLFGHTSSSPNLLLFFSLALSLSLSGRHSLQCATVLHHPPTPQSRLARTTAMSPPRRPLPSATAKAFPTPPRHQGPRWTHLATHGRAQRSWGPCPLSSLLRRPAPAASELLRCSPCCSRACPYCWPRAHEEE